MIIIVVIYFFFVFYNYMFMFNCVEKCFVFIYIIIFLGKYRNENNKIEKFFCYFLKRKKI